MSRHSTLMISCLAGWVDVEAREAELPARSTASVGSAKNNLRCPAFPPPTSRVGTLYHTPLFPKTDPKQPLLPEHNRAADPTLELPHRGGYTLGASPIGSVHGHPRADNSVCLLSPLIYTRLSDVRAKYRRG